MTNAKVSPFQPVVTLGGKKLNDFGDRLDSERFRSGPRNPAAQRAATPSVSGGKARCLPSSGRTGPAYGSDP